MYELHICGHTKHKSDGGEKGDLSLLNLFFFLFFNSKWTFEKVTPLQSALKIEKNPKEHTILKVQFLSKNS